ncbi:hypothetical protein FGG08_000511 [Glutinoglossum americanum]|uniref:Uncharacterized protein n=1 Tax=Glutinoglossum americanum TaxID=1670608 RepID=A0A9P8L5Y3_9PEZI|nr:hypothetical protein FGG08_000511 [Glutinoglossum americanum]
MDRLFGSNNLDGFWSFRSDAPGVDESDLLPPGDFPQSFGHISRPSSIDMTNVTTPTSFNDTSNVLVGMPLGFPDYPHDLGVFCISHGLVGGPTETAGFSKQLPSPSSNDVIQANALIPSAETSPKSKDIKLEAKSIWKPITELPTSRTDEFKVVELSQGHNSEKLRLRVREYNPEPGDKQYYTWYDGDSKYFYNTTPYAITDLRYARSAIKNFLDKNLEGYLDVLLLNASPITKRTFRTALQNRDLTLLGPALKLWVASRFIETPWHITGSETLGMSRDTHIKSPYRDWVPQTPIMDFQLDNLVIHGVLQPLLKEILTTLRTKSSASKPEDWFERQLTYFILLNTIELTMAHDVEFARRYRVGGSRWSNRQLIGTVTQGANTLLTCFHNANNDHYPFSAPWPEVERSHKWSQEQKTYITEIRALLEQQQEIQTEPAQEMFWTGQLHRAGWIPVSVVV